MAPKILLLGYLKFAHDEWKQLGEEFGEIAEELNTTREQLIKDFQGKYSEIEAIFANFAGEKAVGGIKAELIDAIPKSVKVFANNGAGYDLVDVVKLGERGIQVSNTPTQVTEATATTAIYLIIGALRNFNKLSNELRKGNWDGKTAEAHDLEEKTLGILGLGGIGKSIRDKAVPFNFSKIVYHNRNRLPEAEEGAAEYVSFDELLATSDVIAVSVPLNAKTRHLINAETLAKTKDGVVIVNTARGAVIDEEALVQALESGKVSTAGLDVFEYEPKIHPKLLENENILLLPHVGTHTVESRKKMELGAINNIRAALTTGKVVNLVPELQGKF